MEWVRQGAAVAMSAMVAVMLSLALGSLLFTGQLATHASAGVSIALFTSVVVGVVVALRSSVHEALAGVQDSPAILLALAAGALASSAPAALDPQVLYASVLMLIAVGTTVTGAVAFALGRLRLGALIRFMPYPVVGGFLAGTGWLMVTGAIEMLTGTTPSLAGLPDLVTADATVRWMPPLVAAGALLWALKHWDNPLVLPAAIPVLIGVFYVVLALLGHTPQAALDGGWLLGPFPEAALWRPDPLWAVQHAEWSLVLGQAGALASLLLVVLVSIVLTSSGLELALDTEVDVDRELRANGLGNILAGLLGGAVGYTYLSDTVLGRALGGRGRAFGVTVAGVSAVVLVIGGQPLAWFPRPIVGVILMLLGLMFLHEWVIGTWRRMPRLEHAIVVAILLVIALFGFLPGMAFGIVLAVLLFVVAASRIDVVKHELSGVDRPSWVDRSLPEQALLTEARAHVHVLVLHGFLFFGTAHAVADRVQVRAENPREPELRYVVLDFRLVTGIDSSAVFSFVKLQRRLGASGAVLVLSQVPGDTLRALEAGGLAAAPEVVTATDLDHAVQCCEDKLLEGYEVEVDLTDLQTALRSLLPATVDPSELLRLFERVDLQPGERLIEQGSPPSGLYLLTAGVVSVERTMGSDAVPGEAPERVAGPAETVRLRLLRAGAVVGEMSLYLDATTSASVVAVTAVSAAWLPVQSLAALEEEQPALAAALHRALVRTLAQRLSDSHRAIEALLD